MVGIIGFGNMGSILARGLLESGGYRSDEIYVCDKKEERLAYAREILGVMASRAVWEVAASADPIIIAVKPQDLKALLTAAGGAFDERLVISIVAGKTIAEINELYGKKLRLARAMPSILCASGRGVTLLAFSEEVSEEDKTEVNKIFSSVSTPVEIEEHLMNEAMSISSCGPALFYYILEAMVDAGVSIGLSRPLSEKLCLETFAGSAEHLLKCDKDYVGLKNQVVSPGGATARALAVFDDCSLRGVLRRALEAAVARASEL